MPQQSEFLAQLHEAWLVAEFLATVARSLLYSEMAVTDIEIGLSKP